MKIGLFFGSFNPVHKGHVCIAKHLLRTSDLEHIWFVVSPQNPFKKKEDLIPFSYRYQMTQIEADKDPKVIVCDIEQQLEHPHYTSITLELLEKTKPHHEFSLIIGSDNLEYFHRWKDYKQILKKYAIYVYPRTKQQFPIHSRIRKENANIKIIHDAPIFNISSTKVREAIKYNNFSGAVSEEVAEYIKSNGLYGINDLIYNGSDYNQLANLNSFYSGNEQHDLWE